MSLETVPRKSYRRKTVLCECDRRKGKLLYTKEDGYEYKGGCIKDAICSELVRLKHKQWRERNESLQKQGEVTIYEG